MIGYLDGWKGVLDDSSVPLDVVRCRDILALGGTILGTSRTNPFKIEDGPQRVRANLTRRGVDALVAVGGEDTLGVAQRLGDHGVSAVGVPKTIDNDLSGTELTFGFDTAVQIATEAIDRLRTTAESHHRVIVCEVMGRHVGWIATHAGIAGGAAEILVPEVPFDIDGGVRAFATAPSRRAVLVHRGGLRGRRPGREPRCRPVASRHGQHSGAPVDQFGHARLGGIGAWLAEEIERRTGFEARYTILGHIQRGGTPSAFDRVLATRFGVAAVGAVHDGAFGMMVALRCGEIVRVPIADAVAQPKTVDRGLYGEVAGVFLG